MKKYHQFMNILYHKILLKYLILFILLFSTFLLEAESLWQPLKTEIPERKILTTYTLSNLPNKDVCSVIKDKQGFLWIGTFDGLYRFDGVHYEAYSTTSLEHKIQSNMIHSITQANDGSILVSFYGSGCCEIDYNKNVVNSFIPSKMLNNSLISNNVMSIIKRNNGDILIAIKNGIVVHSKDEKNRLLTLDYFGLKNSDRLKNIYIDNQDNVWISTFNKLYKIKNNTITQSFSINVNDVSFYNKKILIASNKGIYLFNQENDNNLIKIDDGIFKKVIFSGGDICSIKEDKIIYYSNVNNKWTEKFYLDKSRIKDNYILENMSDCISFSYKWIFCCSSTNGIIAINKSTSLFNNFSLDNNYSFLEKDCIRSLFQDSNNKIWLGYEKNKLTVINSLQNNRKTKKIQIPDNKTNNILCMEEIPFKINGKNNNIIFLGNRENQSLIAYSLDDHKNINLPGIINNIGNVFVLRKTIIDSNKFLWCGTYGNGLSRILFSEDGKIIKTTTFNKKLKGLNSNIIRAIEQSSNGNLYIGSDGGLNVISKTELEKEHPVINKIKLSNDSYIEPYIIQLRNVNDSILAIGTMSRGLILYNLKSNNYQSVTKEKGLPSNKIKMMLLDNENNIWIGGGKSITKYDYKSGNLIVFNIHSGLPDVNFVETCCTKLKNGKILFGTTNSIISFVPENINRNLKPKNPIVTKFEAKTNNKIEYKDINSFINKISNNKEIKLPYSNNNISITFTSPNIISGLNNVYSYKLLKEGDSEQNVIWKKVDALSNKLEFTNLHEGKYVFKLKADNITNTTGSKPIYINIKILPPFIRSNIGIFIIITILLLSLYMIFFFIRKSLIRKKLFFRKIKEKETETELIKQEITNILTQNDDILESDKDLSSSDKDLLKNIVSKIKENISNPDYTTKTISSECGISSVTLNKKISTLTGQTIFQLQTKIKLNLAKKLLSDSNLNINEIAWKVGYNDANAFRRKFKSTFNMTPSEWTNKNSSK